MSRENLVPSHEMHIRHSLVSRSIIFISFSLTSLCFSFIPAKCDFKRASCSYDDENDDDDDDDDNCDDDYDVRHFDF